MHGDRAALTMKRVCPFPDVLHTPCVQVVLDLGRPPLARFPSGDKKLSLSPVTKEDLEYAIAQVERGRRVLKGVQVCRG